MICQNLYYCSQSWCSSSSEIEDVTSSLHVIVVILFIESNVVAGDRSVKSFDLRDSEAIDSSVHVWEERLHCSIKLVVKLGGSRTRNNIVKQVPCRVLFDNCEHVEESGLNKDLFHSWVRALLNRIESSLKHVSLTKCLCNRLDLIGNFIHPHIEECLSLLHNLLLHELDERLHFTLFSEEDQVLQRLEVSDTVEGRDLSNWALGQLWHHVLFLLHVRHDVFDDFLHEHTVVTLSSHA